MNGEQREQFAIDRLNELRHAMQNEECPRKVRAFVLDHFEQDRVFARRTWRRPFAWAVGAAFAFAVFIVAIIILQTSGGPHSEPEHVANATATAPPSVEPQGLEHKGRVEPVSPMRVAATKPRVRRTAAPARAETAAVSREASREIATEFLALPYAPPLYPDEGADVVRVRLPRSAMRSFGLPVNEERLNERVPADVILGQDGIARAVRFVKVAQ